MSQAVENHKTSINEKKSNNNQHTSDATLQEEEQALVEVIDTVEDEATVIEPSEVTIEVIDGDLQDEETLSITDLQAELEAARAEATKNLDGWQRTAADLANYKKRQEEQVGRRREEITARIIEQLFPVLDDLDLAFDNMPAELDEQTKNWIEGFKLVQRKVAKILESNNVEPIETEGEFNPNLHEAVTYEANPDYESNTIIAELRKGYKLGQRTLRPSLVRVAQ